MAAVYKGVDSKGTKRGRCQGQDCEDCDQYSYNTEKGEQCTFCGCFPTKHLKLSQEEQVIAEAEKLPPKEDVLGLFESSDSSGDGLKHFEDISIDSGIYDVDNITGEMRAVSAGNSSVTEVSVASVRNINSTQTIHLPSTSDATDQSTTSRQKWDNILSKLSRQEIYQLCVPSQLPDCTANNIKKNNAMLASERQFVLRWMVYAMVSNGVTSDKDYVEVATLAINRYPELQCALSKGVHGVVKSMKDVLRNHTYYENRKFKKSSEFDDRTTKINIDQVKSQIQKEMAAQSPSLVSVKALLSSCRNERTALSRKQHCRIHLAEFPCLSLPDILFWEFRQLEHLEMSTDDLKMRWVNCIPKMCNYFGSGRKAGPLPQTLSQDQATTEILNRLVSPSFFGTKKAADKRDRSSYLLEVFKEKTLLRSTLPAADDPPRLIAIGDLSKDNLCTSIYVDGKALYSGTVVDSLIHLLAIYYVFQIAPAADVRAAFAFLCGVFLQKDGEKEYKKYKSVLKVLELLKCVPV